MERTDVMQLQQGSGLGEFRLVSQLRKPERNI